MKKLLFALLVLAALVSTTLLAMAQSGKAPYQVKEFPVQGPANLITETSGGSITVTGGSGKVVKVRMFVKPANGSQKDQQPSAEALENYRFDIRQQGNTIYAVAERKSKTWDKKTALQVSFEIETPRQTTTRLRTSGGSITLAHLAGSQQAHTSGGGLRFTDIQGPVEARTSGGGIQLQQYKGDLEAATSGGSIQLSEARGKLRVKTSGGSIRLQQVSGDIEAQTSGGSIHAQVQELGKYLTLETSGGSVEATIPRGKGLDLDLSGNRVKTSVQNFTGEAKDNKVKGRMNGGGILVKMSTSGGHTELNFR
ncbi:MAG: DUF4097 family beta strand repeat-containing protein [Adhaeribacter sp.]